MFKKVNLFFSASLFAFLLLPLCFSQSVYSQQEFYPFLGEVTADDVHIRSGQSENFESLFKVELKDQLIVIDKSYSWYKIELPHNAKSFISEEFVLLTKDGKGIITANRLNIRSGPGPHFTVLGQLNEGQEVFVIEEQEGWLQIQPVADTYGWILDKYVSFKSKNVEDYRKKAQNKKFNKGKSFVLKQDIEESLIEEADQSEAVSGLKQKVENDLNAAPAFESSASLPGDVQAQDKQSQAPMVMGKEEIDKNQEIWANFEKIKIIETNNRQHISVEGNIQPQKEIESKEIKYKFLIEGQTVFYIKGFKHILEEFLNFHVKLEGEVMSEEQTKQPYPVVEIHKIQLVL